MRRRCIVRRCVGWSIRRGALCCSSVASRCSLWRARPGVRCAAGIGDESVVGVGRGLRVAMMARVVRRSEGGGRAGAPVGRLDRQGHAVLVEEAAGRVPLSALFQAGLHVREVYEGGRPLRGWMRIIGEHG